MSKKLYKVTNTMLEAARKIEELEGRLIYNAKENKRHGNTNK